MLQALYNLGLRKFLLAGIGPLGCIPNQRSFAPPDRCVDYVNQILGTYNEGLKSLVDQLNTHPGALFLYGNTYGAVGDILNNPNTYGKKCYMLQNFFSFTEIWNKVLTSADHDIQGFSYDYSMRMFIISGFSVEDKGCCGIGRNQGQITCLPWVVPCSNRNTSVFWDAFHPTEAVNSILAQRAFNGPPRDCYPINVQQMTLFYWCVKKYLRTLLLVINAPKNKGLCFCIDSFSLVVYII